MNEKDIEWIYNLKHQIPNFLESLKGKKCGFFHYSLSGDIYGEKIQWGLGNTVFAVKIYHVLNMIDDLSPKEVNDMSSFIKNFQTNDGSIYDPLIQKKSSLSNLIYSVRNMDFSNLRGAKTMRAETRQSFSALELINSKPDIPYLKIPYTPKKIEEYIKNLNWNEPWGAGSHFSHLMYFINANRRMFKTQEKSADFLLDHAIKYVNKIQSPTDGSWYTGEVISKPNKINGAMKVITGLNAAGKLKFKHSKELIDMCLSSSNLEHACNALDVIYVMRYANELEKYNYRYEEIQEYSLNWLNACKNHYYEDIGGFSFYNNRSNQNYYSARITKGFKEPDIHGTVLLLWGISLVSEILGIDKYLGFKELPG